MDWRTLTDQEPGPTPVTKQMYERHGIPWFHLKALMAANANALGGVQSIAKWARAHGFDVDAKDFEAPVETKGAPLVTYVHKGEKGEGGLAVESVGTVGGKKEKPVPPSPAEVSPAARPPKAQVILPPPPPKVPGAVGQGKVKGWKRLLPKGLRQAGDEGRDAD